MTSTKAAGNAALTLASSTRPVRDDAVPASAGWDPFEVWRTRVLLPRLEDKQVETGEPPGAPSPLVRSA